MNRNRLTLEQLAESWPSDSQVMGPHKESMSVFARKIVTFAFVFVCLTSSATFYSKRVRLLNMCSCVCQSEDSYCSSSYNRGPSR